jgi:predicted hydrocarbon binding protein
VTHDSSGGNFSHLILHQFIELMVQDVGAEKITLILAIASLPDSLLEKPLLENMGSLQAVETYASLQKALRMYYGRSARGLLVRIGRRLWDNTINKVSIKEKAELWIVRVLPAPSRRKRVVEMIADWLQIEKDSTTVHLLDVDLLLVDRGSAATRNQSEDEPICYVTLGLLQGALSWATGHEADVAETACRAMGAPACEFKIRIGG